MAYFNRKLGQRKSKSKYGLLGMSPAKPQAKKRTKYHKGKAY